MTCNYYFILKDKEAIETDALTWGRWFGGAIEQRIVAKSKGADGSDVSTVFVGLNMRFMNDGPPLIFETMIFGGEHDQYQDRCSTWNEAIEMHQTACKLVGANP